MNYKTHSIYLLFNIKIKYIFKFYILNLKLTEYEYNDIY